MNLIAIDFGTELTKLAYIDASTKSLELLRIGKHDDPYWPSLFHVSAKGDVSVGDDAHSLLEEDPGGIIHDLKRRLRVKSIRRNKKTKTPGQLLVALFSKLRERALRTIPGFGPDSEISVILTHPAVCGPEYKQILKKAARDSGFKEVTLISEPVAAAWYWQGKRAKPEDHVVVLDCGGGTVDWAFLRAKDGKLGVDGPPGGNDRLGGRDIDEGLLKQIRGDLEGCNKDHAVERLKKDQTWYRGMIRKLKERYNSTGFDQELQIGKIRVEIEAQQFSRIAEEKFIQQVLADFKSYLDPIKKRLKQNPPILLVGGSANLKGLEEQVEEGTQCPVVKLDRCDWAPVLGARFFVFVENLVKGKTVASGRTKERLLQDMTKMQLRDFGSSLGIKLSMATRKRGMVDVLKKRLEVTRPGIISFLADQDVPSPENDTTTHPETEEGGDKGFWVRHSSKHGNGWLQTGTGRIVYQDSPPGKTGVPGNYVKGPKYQLLAPLTSFQIEEFAAEEGLSPSSRMSRQELITMVINSDIDTRSLKQYTDAVYYEEGFSADTGHQGGTETTPEIKKTTKTPMMTTETKDLLKGGFMILARLLAGRI